jgi:pimeloyl-ACP methyl ester carboxylesterase
VSKSAPIVSYEDAANFNIDYALRYRGYSDSLVTEVMPLWKRHHAAWARNDTSELEAVAVEIIRLREEHDPFLLPTPYREVFTDTNLVFLWPSFRSASRDYLSELEHLRVPWLAIYGELDPIVPVKQSVTTIQSLMTQSRNEEYAIVVLAEVGHSFMNRKTGKQLPALNIAINWLKDSVL